MNPTLRFPRVLLAGLLISGCTTAPDPLHQAALDASYQGTLAGTEPSARKTAGLDAAARVVERYYWVAKYEATRQQREVVVERAKRLTAPAKTSSKPRSRYIAVETRADSRAKTQTSVMIWDTQSQNIVGNDIYDINDRPPSGSLLKFDTYSAVYVGQR